MERGLRQQEIVREATELFARHGYRAVGMRAIAQAVGIRTSSLYHHFPSKQDLLYAIAMTVTRDFIAGHDASDHVAMGARERLEAFVRDHVQYFARHRAEQVVSRRELVELRPEHLAEALRYERVYQARTEEILRAGLASGVFRPLDPKLTALALLDMLNGLSAWYHDDGPLDASALADAYATLALNLVGAMRHSQ